MSHPYIQGLIHDSDGRSIQFLLGPDGYRQWGSSGRSGTDRDAAYARNVEILTALEEAAEKVRFFDDAEEEQAEEQQR